MTDLEATTRVRYEFSGRVVGRDGYVLNFIMDDSFKSWWNITRWNMHYRYWGALRMNARDLFTKIIWKKVRIWPR